MSQTAVKLRKQSLRISITSKLANLNKQEIERQSTLVFQKVKENANFKQAKSVALYMSMPSVEIDTLQLIRHCFDQQKSVFLPSCFTEGGKPTKTMRFLQLNSFEEVMNLEPRGKYNLREPASGEDIMDSGDLDIIIVPGVAFTNEGERLGRGAGFYDRFLTEYLLKFGQKPFLLGVGLKEQLILALPTESHDWTLDQVEIGD